MCSRRIRKLCEYCCLNLLESSLCMSKIDVWFTNDLLIRLPIHCAIMGNSEKLLRWLVDVQCCPIHVLSTSNNKAKKKSNATDENVLPTLSTSRGRSVLDVAMATRNVGILRYLVNEKGASVHEMKDLGLVLGAMEALIREFPDIEKDSNARGGSSGDTGEKNYGTAANADDTKPKGIDGSNKNSEPSLKGYSRVMRFKAANASDVLLL